MQLLQIGARKTWMAPELNQINRLPMRAIFLSFPDAAAARCPQPYRSLAEDGFVDRIREYVRQG